MEVIPGRPKGKCRRMQVSSRAGMSRFDCRMYDLARGSRLVQMNSEKMQRMNQLNRIELSPSQNQIGQHCCFHSFPGALPLCWPIFRSKSDEKNVLDSTGIFAAPARKTMACGNTTADRTQDACAAELKSATLTTRSCCQKASKFSGCCSLSSKHESILGMLFRRCVETGNRGSSDSHASYKARRGNKG